MFKLVKKRQKKVYLEYTQFIFQVAQSDFTKFLLSQKNDKKIIYLFLQKFRQIAQINQL